MLKRSIVLILLFGMMLVNISAKEETKISYVITFDTHESCESEWIDKINDTYQRLTRSIIKSNHAVIIRQSLDEFKLTENTKVSYDSNVLNIVMGDGKGTKIEGDFHWIECVPEIETSSWILEKLGF